MELRAQAPHRRCRAQRQGSSRRGHRRQWRRGSLQSAPARGAVALGDEATGANIVRVALEAPLKQIAQRRPGPGVVPKVRNSATGTGLNAATNSTRTSQGRRRRPVKVTRSALQNAASIAALFLTTEAVVADKPEKAAAPAGDPTGGMGGMDF